MDYESFFVNLAQHARAEGLKYLIVGGNAVNLHQYYRTTFDIDILIPETSLDNWRAYFAEHENYEMSFKTHSFAGLESSEKRIPLDLMLVDQQTFEKLSRDSIRIGMGDVELPIPEAVYLIAMKPHALKNTSRADRKHDFQDIIHLIDLYQLDVNDMPQPNPKNDSCNTSKGGEPAVEYGATEMEDNFLDFPDWPDVPLPE
ncbi:MAG: hypothetical protein AAF649_05475 [Verrucomicrobiota bacterium]